MAAVGYPLAAAVNSMHGIPMQWAMGSPDQLQHATASRDYLSCSEAQALSFEKLFQTAVLKLEIEANLPVTVEARQPVCIQYEIYFYSFKI